MFSAKKERNQRLCNPTNNNRRMNLKDKFNLMFSVRLLRVLRLQSAQTLSSFAQTLFICVGHSSNNNDAPNSSTHIVHIIFS